MTKTVEELKAEWNVASAALKAARNAEFNARLAYEDGVLEATGLKGHKVTYEYRAHRQPVQTRAILVDGCSGRRVTGKRILKDGSLGTARGDPNIEDVTDHGLFVPAVLVAPTE